MGDDRFKKGLIGRFISRLFHKQKKTLSNTEYVIAMRKMASIPSRVEAQEKIQIHSKRRRYGDYIDGPLGKIPTEAMLPRYIDHNLRPSVLMEKKKNMKKNKNSEIER